MALVVASAQVQENPFDFESDSDAAKLENAAKSFPEAFDLRHCDTDGDGVYENYVTPVKLQNPFGTCWGFGAIAAAEISLLGSGLAQADGYGPVADPDNGVKELKILTGDEARAMEPAVSDAVVAALWAPTAGIVCPFNLCIALAENAADNGVEFKFLTEVENIKKTAEGFRISTNNGEITAKTVVNAAGVYADKIHNLVSADKLTITPRRGEYVLMDKEVGGLVSATIFQLPGKLGKGVLVTPTVHGNLLVGPNAQDLEDKEDTETTQAGMDDIKKRALLSVPGVPYNKMITSFAGLRAHEARHDFILGEVSDCEGFFDAAGIESPGLTSAPAIGEYMADMIAVKLSAKQKENFNPNRKGFIEVAKLPREERARLIKECPEYGRIVCRCENISEGEILDAINRTLGAKSLDGVKRRVRQGMGRCQAGFCTPRTMELLARELKIPMTEVRKNRPGSELLKG